MANTTNFNWETPDDTDLVKDGAAAIRTLGSAIDTSLVDLKGGTTGQVLSKTTNTDMDFTWVSDATGIPATIFDAKGDIIAATAADTASRLAVGSNDQVLTADSSTATGLKWATPSGTTFNGARVFDSGTQSISNATNTAITFNSESYDTNSYHSTTTNTSRLTVPSTGYYLFSGQIFVDANATGGRYLEIKKNGTTVQAMETGATTQASVATFLPITAILSATANDYFELFLYQTSGGTRTTYTSGAAYNSFSVQYLGA